MKWNKRLSYNLAVTKTIDVSSRISRAITPFHQATVLQDGHFAASKEKEYFMHDLAILKPPKLAFGSFAHFNKNKYSKTHEIGSFEGKNSLTPLIVYPVALCKQP